MAPRRIDTIRPSKSPGPDSFDALLPSIPNNVRPSAKVIMSKLDELEKGSRSQVVDSRPGSRAAGRPGSRAAGRERPSSRASSAGDAWTAGSGKYSPTPGAGGSAPSQPRHRGMAEPSKKGKGISGLLYMKDQSQEYKHMDTVVKPCSKGLDYVNYKEAEKVEQSIWSDEGWDGEHLFSEEFTSMDDFTETMPSFMAPTTHHTSTFSSCSFRWNKSNLLQNNKLRVNMMSFRPVKVKEKPAESVVVRQQRLQEQFVRTEDEIRKALDLLIKLAKQPLLGQWLLASSLVSEEFPGIVDLLKQFKLSSISLVPELPATAQAQVERRLFAGRMKDDTMTMSDIQEKHVALMILNYYRWLCGCPPMQHDRDAHNVCKMVAETLLPRSSLILKPTDPRATRIIGLGNNLKDFLTQNGSKICVLQLEASLGDAVKESLNASFVGDPRIPHSIPREQLIHDFISSRMAHAKESNEEDHSYQSVQDVPSPSLNSLKILWDLASTSRRRGATSKLFSIEHTHSKETTKEDSQSVLSGSVQSGFMAKLARAAGYKKPKVRTVNMKGKEKVGARDPGGILGDIGSAVNFRRFLLNPDLVYFGAHRMQDTCVFWSGHAAHGIPNESADKHKSGDAEEPAGESAEPNGGHAAEPEKSPSSKTFAEQHHKNPEPESGDQMWTQENSAVLRPLTPEKPKSAVGEQFVPVKPDMNTPAPAFFHAPTKDHKISTFPPCGIVPIESVQGLKEWSIMPHYCSYQPTQGLQLEMWRVRLTTPSMSTNHEYVADRLSSVSILEFNIDCSAKGNPFCVIFKPDIVDIHHGDCFEVRLTGLTGQDTELNCFYEFRRVLMDPDAGLAEEAAKFRKLMDPPAYWGLPSETYVARIGAIGNPKDIAAAAAKEKEMEQAKTSPSSRQRRSVLNSSNANEVNVNTIDIGLVTHPVTTFDTNSSEIKIVVVAPVMAMKTSLFLVRNTGSIEVARASIAHKLGDNRWLIHGLLPMPASRYELTFDVGITEHPGTLERHKLSYLINTTEKSQVMLVSLDTPLFASFGFANFSSLCHWKNITIISPIKHRLGTGFVYFLVHIEDALKGQVGEMTRQTLSKMLTTRRISTLISSGEATRGSFTKESMGIIGKMKGAVADLTESVKAGGTQSGDMIKEVHRIMAEGCPNMVNHNLGAIHLDLSINRGKYRLRMRQRKDFPEFFEALVKLDRQDFNVELVYRGLQSSQYAPVKIAEWTCDGYRDIYR